MFRRFLMWPQFSFRERWETNHADGTPVTVWKTFLSHQNGEETYIGFIYGFKRHWKIPIEGKANDIHKTRKDAAQALLEEDGWSPNPKMRAQGWQAQIGSLRAECTGAEETNVERPQQPLTKKAARNIYRVLEEECGASDGPKDERGKEMFVLYYTQDDREQRVGSTEPIPPEWRFTSPLGNNCRFIVTPRRWYVECDDQSLYSELCVAEANARLQALWVQLYGEKT